jgi:hypothetical protein
MGCTDQSAVDSVRPAMVGAGKSLGISAPFHKPHHAMPANIRHRMDGLIRQSNHNDRLAADLIGNEVAGLRNVIHSTRAQPLLVKNSLLFSRQQFL